MPKRAETVDELDFRILRELLAGDTDFMRSDRASIDKVGRKLGLHRNTVSQRVAKLTRMRVVLPMSLSVESAMLGMVGAKVFLELPHERRNEATMSALFRLEGVVTVLTYLEGWDIFLYAESDADLDSKVEQARRITGAARVNWDMRSSTDYPMIPPATLSRLDVELIASLLEDARMPFATLARRLGVATKTAERRYKRLQNAGVIRMLPGGGGPRGGMIMAYVLIEVPEGRARREKAVGRLLTHLPNHVMRNLAARSKVDFFLYCDSTIELERQIAEVRRIDGVERVQFRLFTQQHRSPYFREWLLRVLKGMVRRTA